MACHGAGYNPSENFSWPFAGFYSAVRRFFPSGGRSHSDRAKVKETCKVEDPVPSVTSSADRPAGAT